MAEVNRSALVTHSAEKMFDLVNDLESYPEFLPWCKSVSIEEQTEDILQGSIQMSKAGINKTFTTRNHLQRPERIDLQLVNGPFKKLEGYWQFKALSEDACKVSLQLEFTFDNALLEKVVGPVFKQIANTLLDAFVKRADGLYGQR